MAYSAEKKRNLCKQIIDRVSGGEPLAVVCRDLKLGVTTWYDWERADPELFAAIARAREAGEEIILADTMSIVDTEPERTPTEHGDKVDAGHVQWLKNRAEQRMKLLAKWNPRKWGDKVALGGADDMPAIRTESTVTLEPGEAYKRLLGVT